MKQKKQERHFEIEILHTCGHITRSKIDLSEFDNLSLFDRIGRREEAVNEALKHVKEQLPKGTQYFLTIKSKYE